MGALMQVRNVPEETRRTLKARAAARGESLNAYVLDVLTREVARPTVAEVLERAAARSEQTSVSCADLVRQARAERGEELARRVRG